MSCAASTARAGSRPRRSPGYRQETEVDPESETETFVAGAADDRRLALVRRAVLRADRQAPAQAGHRDRDPVPRGPAPPVQGRGHRTGRQPARDPDPAGRGHHAALRGQGARPPARRPLGDDGLHLRLGVQRGLARRVRDAHPRRPPGRRLAVHAGRRGRGGVGHRRPDHQRLGRRAGAGLPELRRRDVGSGRPPTSCRSATAGAGAGSEAAR